MEIRKTSQRPSSELYIADEECPSPGTVNS